MCSPTMCPLWDMSETVPSGSNATITVLTLQIVLLFCFPKHHQLEFSDFATCKASFQISEVFFGGTKMAAKAKQIVSEHFKCHFCDQHMNFEKLPAQSIISDPQTLKICDCDHADLCAWESYDTTYGLS